MVTIIITGGIATGKSTACKAWLEMEPDSAFHDADATVHALYGDRAVRAEIAAAFGADALIGEDEVDRSLLRRAITADPGNKKMLEGILHPRVRSVATEAHANALAAGKPWFLADIPLYFEAGEWKPCADAKVVVVACSRETQRIRLQQRNPFDIAEAGRIIAMQADLAAKMAASDHVLWNEGSPAALRRQIQMLRDCLRH